MNSFRHIWMNVSNNPLIRFFLDKLGIKVHPFYIFLEELQNGMHSKFETGFEEYSVGLLGPQDMETIAAIPGRNYSLKSLLQRLKEGNICYGIKHQGKIIAFTWCDLSLGGSERYRFSIKDDEAYLFDAYTILPFRGKGIAPYIRYQLYKELAKLGRKRLYSISDCFNDPALKFKKKLNSKLYKLILFVEIFKKYNFSMVFKRYPVDI